MGHIRYIPVLLIFLYPEVGMLAAELPRQSVQIDYIQQEQFTDIASTEHGPPNQSYLDQLSKHIMKKAASYLAEDEQLSIAITDIDMAGSFEPWNTPGNDIRMIRHIYPPRISLSYQLKNAGGNVLEQGDVRLTDLNYQFNSTLNSADAMRYEKALVDDWLEKLFAGRPAPQGD